MRRKPNGEPTAGSWARAILAIAGGLALLVACAAAQETRSGEAGAPTPDPGELVGLEAEASTAGLTLRTDRGQSAVPLGDIVIDTFDGSSVPYDRASDDLLERLLDAIPPIDRPRVELGSEATWLASDNLVLGTVGPRGTAVAAAHRQLAAHEIVHLDLDGRPLAITFCPLCGSGVVFDRRAASPDLGERELSFSNTSGLYESDMVMIDRETASLWWQFPGLAIVGELTGAKLDVVASETTTWATWLERHPDTWVLSADQGFGRDYDAAWLESYPGRLDADRSTRFPTSPSAFADDRLRPGERVLVVDDTDVVHAISTERGAGRVRLEMTSGRTVVAVVAEDGSAWLETPEGAREAHTPSRSAFWFTLVGSADGDIRVHEVSG